MTRAQETGGIILEYLKEKTIPQITDCNLLREGAPAPPEPAGSQKRPAVYVSGIITICVHCPGKIVQLFI